MVKSSRKWMSVLVLMGCCLAWGHSAVAEEKAADGGKGKKKAAESNLADSLSLTSRREPIRISSRDLEFLYEKKRIVYRGDVVAIQGDVTMKSDLLTVIYEDAQPTNSSADTGSANAEPTPASPGVAASKQRLKEIVAEGHVDIISGNRRATGKKAIFNEAQRVVVLSGEARVQELGNWVSGERVTVYLDEKRSIVEGGGGDRRAEMEIRPEQQEGDKKGSKKP
ncbi:MAG: hypothetical protein HYZ50_11890 [Deltaproteobacteria bacterium]|nr:hypothetical protein [Deltaproteobacteria bacterium]